MVLRAITPLGLGEHMGNLVCLPFVIPRHDISQGCDLKRSHSGLRTPFNIRATGFMEIEGPIPQSFLL